MTTWFLIIIFCIAAATFVSLLLLWRSDFTRPYKCIFSFLRIGMGVAFTCVLIEPSVSLKQLSDSNTPLPVLIDASASMSHFSADSVVISLKQRIDSLTVLNPEKARKIKWYFFGDSLRESDNLHSTFSDKRSIFPNISTISAFRKSPEMFILSDGQWSNSTLPLREYASGILWYIPLTMKYPPSGLRIDMNDTVSTTGQTAGTMKIHCRGYVPDSTRLSLALTGKDTVIYFSSPIIPRGVFNHTFNVTLPVQRPGYHLYDCRVLSAGDSLQSTGRFVYHVHPESWSYKFMASYPSVDQRFLRLALSRDHSFSPYRKKSGQREPDVLFIIGNVSGGLSDTGKSLRVFIGKSHPASSGKGIIRGTDSLQVSLSSQTAFNPFAKLPLSDLPPIHAVMHRNSETSPTQEYITVSSGNKSFPVLYSVLFNGPPSLFCTMFDFWKWDFLPLSHATGEAENFSFTESLLQLIEQILVSRSNDTLIVFSPGAISRSDSLRLLCITPSIPDSARPLLFMHILNQKTGSRQDTALPLRSLQSPIRSITTLPFSVGTYTLTCSLSVENIPYYSRSIFTVDSDNSEHLVSRQNEALLRQYCTPLALTSNLLESPFFKGNTSENVTIHSVHHLRIKRTWWLLGILLLFFLTELLLRRIQHFD